MKKRLEYLGGATSDGRIVKGKYDSFKSALKNSYQAEWITFNDIKYRCLINPDEITKDYDQKEISIDFSVGMKNGDVFYWDRTDSHWLVYLQRFEEEAYFRAQIRKCEYQINGWWVYLRGPKDMGLDMTVNHNILYNNGKYKIKIYIFKTEETIEYFKRFNIIKFDGSMWRVAAVDRYTQQGLIEVYLEEYPINDMADQQIVPEIIKPDTTHPYIDGPQVVKAFDENINFSIVGLTNGLFTVNSTKVKIKESDENKCVLDIITGKSGTFEIKYENETETVVQQIFIKSL